MQNKLILLLALIALTGCVTPDTTSQLVKPPEADRVKIARFDSVSRPEVLHVNVIFGQPKEPHSTIALLTVEGAAREEAVLINAIGYHARRIGADAIVLLDHDTPNGNLALAHPLWQPSDRRVFRANAILYAK